MSLRNGLRRILGGVPRSGHVLGINARNRLLIYRENLRRHYPLADDKIRTKEILGQAGITVPRTLTIFEHMYELGSLPARLDPYTEFVVKPSRGKAGSGILVITGRGDRGWLDTKEQSWPGSALKRHVADILFGNYAHGLSDRAIVEERLVQAPVFGENLFPGLPDIRVITLGGRILMAMLRLPTARSNGKANLHQGAIGVGIDCDTGKTTHAMLRGNPMARHPDTGVQLVGRSIHGWAEVFDTALRTAAAVPLGYLGIDISIADGMPAVVLEINVRPGIEIQNANMQGLRHSLPLGAKGGGQP